MRIENLHSKYFVTIFCNLAFLNFLLHNFDIDVLLHFIVLKIEDTLSSDVILSRLSDAPNLIGKLNGLPRAGNFTITTLCAMNFNLANFLSSNVLNSDFGAKRKESRLVVIKNKYSAFSIFLVKSFLSFTVEELNFEFLVRFPLLVINNFNLDFAPFASI